MLAVHSNMPRSPRCYIPGVSVHVIQRGNNRAAIFTGRSDYEVFLELLRRSARRFDVWVHAFTLMTNHYHLLVTPPTADALPPMMKSLDGGYVRYYNRRHQRIGTLWNGRYRGLLIEDERYWLTCLRYIEQNPARAGMAADLGTYPWTSYRAHALGQWPNWLASHPLYDSLGSSSAERQSAYRALCGSAVDPDDALLVR